MKVINLIVLEEKIPASFQLKICCIALSRFHELVDNAVLARS